MLPKKFGMLDGAAHILGFVIGSGIFVSPVVVLKHTGSPGMSLIVWFVAGLIRYISSILLYTFEFILLVFICLYVLKYLFLTFHNFV